jgi:hypothetical protein
VGLPIIAIAQSASYLYWGNLPQTVVIATIALASLCILVSHVQCNTTKFWVIFFLGLTLGTPVIINLPQLTTVDYQKNQMNIMNTILLGLALLHYIRLKYTNQEKKAYSSESSDSTDSTSLGVST